MLVLYIKQCYTICLDDSDASFRLSDDDDVSDKAAGDSDTEAYNSSDVERDEARRKRAKERRPLGYRKQLCPQCGVHVRHMAAHLRKHAGTFLHNCSECGYKSNYSRLFRGVT